MRKKHWWLLAFLAWVLVGLSFGLNDYLFGEDLATYYKGGARLLHCGPAGAPLPPGCYEGGPPLHEFLLWELAYWPVWGAFAPVIFWLARRFPIGRRNWRVHLPLNVLAGLLMLIPQRAAYWACAAPLQILDKGRVSPFERSLLAYNLPLGFMSFAVISLVSHLRNYYRRYRDEELHHKEAQLNALKMQLQPHFLGNTLNSISALLHKDPPAAEEMLVRLGDFLRLTQERADAQMVTLAQELEFIRSYLFIEQMRLRDRLHLDFAIAEEALPAQVPNLLLQPLVENAVTHGVRASLASCHIKIQAARVADTLTLCVCDDGPGLPVLGVTDGIGLSNTKARLHSAYQDKALFSLQEAEGGTLAVVKVPFYVG